MVSTLPREIQKKEDEIKNIAFTNFKSELALNPKANIYGS